MITKSTIDFNKHIEDVKKYYISRGYNKKKIEKINKFIDYYKKSYKHIERVYFPYKIAKFLYMQRKRITKNNGQYWICFVAKEGGEGKSTLAKLFLHFTDNTFNTKTRNAMNIYNFIEIVEREVLAGNKYIGILLDEVTINVHPLSKEGLALENLFTRLRQANLIVGVCVNNLKHIGDFIFDRIHTIIHNRIIKVKTKDGKKEVFKFDLYDKDSDNPKHTIIDDIKTNWKTHGHNTWNLPYIKYRALYRNIGFAGEDRIKKPYNNSNYKINKKQDLLDTFKQTKKILRGDKSSFTKKEIVSEIVKMNPTVKPSEIMKIINIDRSYCSNIKSGVVGTKR